MDNTAAPVVDNPDTQSAPASISASPVAPVATTTDATSVATSWKSTLSPDLKGSPLAGKFEDTPDGLNKAFESHANLEKLLGHEKVPIPKDEKDVEGWNRFSKAMGIPDKAENYGLPDATLPESMKGMTIDKGKFAEVVHAHKLTPNQAKGLWKVYNEIQVDAYTRHVEGLNKQLNDTVTRLKSEWGETYNMNVELGQTVINKFAPDEESNNYITASLMKDPHGIRFLAKIGEQFAENKVGEFQMKRFSLAPEEAQEEINSMVRDMNGPYMNQSGKFSEKEHQVAIDRVNSLRALIMKAQEQG